MGIIARGAVRRLPVIEQYRRSLRTRALNRGTARSYASSAVSFVFDLAKRRRFREICIDVEEEALFLARKGRREQLEGMTTALTAKLLTVSPYILRSLIVGQMFRRNRGSFPVFVNSVSQFFEWLRAEGLIETNHFERQKERVLARSRRPLVR